MIVLTSQYLCTLVRVQLCVQLQAGCEPGCCGRAGTDSHAPPALIAVDDGYFRHSNLPRFAGVATPVFSLRTLHSVGSGEFADIERLADLCSAIGATSLANLQMSLALQLHPRHAMRP